MIEAERTRRQLNQAALRAIQAHRSSQIAAMVRLQHFTGVRPQEVVAMRPCKMTADGDVWPYQPQS